MPPLFYKRGIKDKNSSLQAGELHPFTKGELKTKTRHCELAATKIARAMDDAGEELKTKTRHCELANYTPFQKGN